MIIIKVRKGGCMWSNLMNIFSEVMIGEFWFYIGVGEVIDF